MSEKLIIRKYPRGEDGYRTFSVRLPQSTVDALDKLAQQSGRTRNALIGEILDFGINNCEIESD
jgi:predicted DNA-binding protein